MFVERLARPILVEFHELIRVHLGAKADELGDGVPARLILHFPKQRLVSDEGRLVIGMGWRIVGQIEAILMIDHVLIEVAAGLDHDVIDQ